MPSVVKKVRQLAALTKDVRNHTIIDVLKAVGMNLGSVVLTVTNIDQKEIVVAEDRIWMDRKLK